VRDREPLRGGSVRVGAARVGWTLRVDRVAPEHEQVKVERPRPPAWTVAPPERTLEPLERNEQREPFDSGIGAAPDVERRDSVAELGLVGDPDRRGGVEPRDADEPRPGQRREGVDSGGNRIGRVADVRPVPDGGTPDVRSQPDVCPNPTQPSRLPRYRSGMPPVAVRILHAEAGPNAGPLELALIAARAELAERHRRGFLAAGAADVRVVAGPPDGIFFGDRLRGLASDALSAGSRGLVVLGSGSVPLATAGDRRAFVEAAAGPVPAALANNVYSADIVAISATALRRAVRDLPSLPADNALPRWLAEVAGIPVSGLQRWRLGIDLDSPLDLLVAGWAVGAARLRTAGIDIDVLAMRLGRVRAILANRRAELVLAGRTSAATLRALERGAACRVRALIEERGLRAASLLAFGNDDGGPDGGAAGSEPGPVLRPPRSTLGLLVDREGPGALGGLLAQLGDGAVVDTRVLMAHRWGADEGGWPPAEDRFAADLLLPDRIADPWLRTLVTGLRDAPIPILAGGHTLVGPGIRLLAARRAPRPRTP
jgi:hypothetical protein